MTDPIPEKDQHFLIDKKILKKEIEIAKLTEEDVVIEIGAGPGILTEELCKKVGRVITFEIDERFKEELSKLERQVDNLRVIYGSALDHSWNGTKIVANIPYSLSEQTIMKAVEEKIPFLVLIIGENFKNLLEEKESKIGIIANLAYGVEIVEEVPRKAFDPIPRVDSYLIRLKEKNKTKKEELILDILRKNGKIKNAIMYSLVAQGKTKNQSREIIKKLEIDENVLEKPVKSITGNFLKLLIERIII